VNNTGTTPTCFSKSEPSSGNTYYKVEKGIHVPRLKTAKKW